MKTFIRIFWLAVAMCGQWTGQAQIAVGFGGIAPITFDASRTLPASEWASSLTGVGMGSGAYVSAADVAAAVQTINQSFITDALERITANTLSEDARHNTAGAYLITQSSGVGATLLKATLRNNSTQPISQITVGYNFGVAVAPGTETAPGHRVFFSTNGQANSWQPIPQFSGLSSAAYVSATLFVGTWMPNTDIYLLWADDNTDQNPDGGYTLDNFSVSNVVQGVPINDLCSGAIAMTDGTVYSVNTANATSTGDLGPVCEEVIGHGVWYTFTATNDGLLKITLGANFAARAETYSPRFPSDPCRAFSSVCDGFNGRLFVTGGTTYWINAGGSLEASGNLTISATLCVVPRVFGAAMIDSFPESGGLRVLYQSYFIASPPYKVVWGFDDIPGTTTLYSTNNPTPNLFSRFFGPFDPFPTNFSVKVENECNSNTGMGGLTPPCGSICLSLGAPVTRTGTDGSGGNAFSYTSGCGNFPAASTRWFRMTALTNATGLATVTTEGSTYDTVLGVFQGSVSSPNNLALVTCNNDINATNKRSRVQFETKPGTNYWLAVNSTNVGTLNVTYGYDLAFASLAYNRTNRILDLRSAALPSFQYGLLRATNFTTNPASWTTLFTTNFTGNASASNNVLRYLDTNLPASTRRFYQIKLLP